MRTVRATADEVLSAHSETHDDPHNLVDEDAVWRHVAMLPPRQRTVLVLRYTADNVDTLSDLWKLDPIETKAHAGQMVLDGKAPPVAPSGRR